MLVRLLVSVLAGLVACSGSATAPGARPQSPATSSSQLRGLAYTFRIDAALTRISAELCMQGRAPARLVYGSLSSAGFVRAPRLVSQSAAKLASPRPLTIERDHIDLTGVAEDACIAYDVDLGAALEQGSFMNALETKSALITSVELFLWRPPQRPAGLAAHASFELPPGVQVSVPWPRSGTEYVLEESAFAFTGHVAFGRFDERTVEVPGGALDVVLLEGFSQAARGLVEAWLANAGLVVAQVTGRFPVARAQVIVMPSSATGSEVRFGHTGRSGGASIMLFTPAEVSLEMLRSDWVAIHEFSHLLHPFVVRPDAWLSEGLATYLQEVLRVRSGMLPAEEAWRRLYEGAQRGQDAEGTLGEESRRMAHSFNYQTVYWAGAAIALMADVELRRRSEGRQSLENALGGLALRPDTMESPATAQSLIAALDAAVGAPVFHEITARFLGGEQLPDLTVLYRELGLIDADGTWQRDPRAPLGWVRDAITAERLSHAQLPLFRANVGSDRESR
jgi:hypothetical protein